MRKFFALLLAFTLTFSMAACNNTGGEAQNGGETSTPNANGETANKATEAVEINVIAAQYGQNTAAWWEQFTKDFMADNEGIKLNVEVVSWNDIKTVVNTRVANEDAPDILNIDIFADYVADDLLLPATDYVSEETYKKLYPSFIDQSVIDGTVWAIPDLASARAMYYNKDILEKAGVTEPPKTWDELKAACEKIKAYDNNIYPWGIDMTTDEGQAAFAYYTWNNGGGFVDDAGNWTLNSDKNVEAIQYAIDLVNAGLTNTAPATDTRYDLQDMFGAGKVAMMIAPNSLPTYIADGGSTVNYGVASIPSNDGVPSVSAGVMDRFMCFKNNYSEAELAAITKFFDYFYEDTRYSEWVAMEGFLPATSTGAEVMVAKDETLSSWIDIIGSCKFYPTAKTEWADVKQGVIDVEQRALLGEDVKTLLDQLQADIAGE